MNALRKTAPSEAARNRLIGAVHFAAKKRGIEGDDYRDMLRAVVGKESCADLTLPEMGKVLDHLNGAARSRSAGEVPQAGKIRALWISGYWLGVVNDRSDASLRAFVKRQTGIETERWLRDPADARKVIEALKSWLTRVAGINWGEANHNPRHHVVRAQIRRLADIGVKINAEMRGYAVTGKSGLAWYGDRDWDALIVDLGRELRGHLEMDV
jgi:phage gp16-like protein